MLAQLAQVAQVAQLAMLAQLAQLAQLAHFAMLTRLIALRLCSSTRDVQIQVPPTRDRKNALRSGRPPTTQARPWRCQRRVLQPSPLMCFKSTCAHDDYFWLPSYPIRPQIHRERGRHRSCCPPPSICRTRITRRGVWSTTRPRCRQDLPTVSTCVLQRSSHALSEGTDCLPVAIGGDGHCQLARALAPAHGTPLITCYRVVR